MINFKTKESQLKKPRGLIAMTQINLIFNLKLKYKTKFKRLLVVTILQRKFFLRDCNKRFLPFPHITSN